MKKNDERRRDPRLKRLNMVSLSRCNEMGVWLDQAVGRTLDISQNGILLELDHYLESGARVRLEVALAEDVIALGGVVCHVEVIEGLERYTVGIEFQELTPKARATLEDYIGWTSP